MTALRERTRAALRGFDHHTATGDGTTPAAVAITVVTVHAEPAVLLTRRAATLRAHSGQFALPGGQVDPAETVPQAARRELAEELGLTLPPGAVLGFLDDYLTRSGYRMSPVVLWAGELTDPLRPRESEVAEVYSVPWSDLDAEPEFVVIPESDRPVIRMPLLDGHRVHAPTAAVLYQFREVVLRGRHTRVAHLEQPVFAWR